MMDVNGIDFDYFLGKAIGFFDSTMNGGKTRALVKELDCAIRSGHNVMAYNSDKNSREQNSIVINGEHPFPARTVRNIPELRADLESKRHVNSTYTASPHMRGSPLLIDGMPQKRGYPLDVVGIDEANLFTLDPQGAQDLIDFLGWSRQNKIAVFMAGLTHDFRHHEFGYINSVLKYTTNNIPQKAICMALVDEQGSKCQRTAMHAQRVWSADFAGKMGLESYLKAEPHFNFVDKENRHYFNEYFPAPFFDKTVRIEEAQDGRIKYLPVCTDCARVPFRDETYDLYNAIVRGDHTFGLLGQPELTTAIVHFLQSENWIQEKSGVLVPVPFYRINIGSYAPSHELSPGDLK